MLKFQPRNTWTRVVSHNHKTRATCLPRIIILRYPNVFKTNTTKCRHEMSLGRSVYFMWNMFTQLEINSCREVSADIALRWRRNFWRWLVGIGWWQFIQNKRNAFLPKSESRDGQKFGQVLSIFLNQACIKRSLIVGLLNLIRTCNKNLVLTVIIFI